MNVIRTFKASFNRVLNLLLGEGVKTASEKMKKENPNYSYPNIC